MPLKHSVFIWYRRVFGEFGIVQTLWSKFSHPFRLARKGPRPFRTLFLLFWPFPWQFSVPPQLSPQELVSRPNVLLLRRSYVIDHFYLRQLYIFKIRDTPLCSLYRLYEMTCTQSYNDMMLESQYFWQHTSWKTADIPDPKDPDLLRYAILASLVEALVYAFNWKIGMGMRRGTRTTEDRMRLAREGKPLEAYLEHEPDWVKGVQGPQEMVNLMPVTEGEADESFLKRNLKADVHQLFNV